MKPSDPDEILWRYLELRERLASAPGQDLVSETGLIFGKSCRTCRAPAAKRVAVQKGRASTYRCGKCQAPWPTRLGFLLKNEVSRPRGAGIESAMSELGTYALALSRLTVRQRRVYAQLYVFEQQGSYAAVAAAANARWPRMRPLRDGKVAGPRWSEWHVRSVCSAARRTLSTATGLSSQRHEFAS